MQSCRLIPALLLPPADPAGAKPRRDHRFLDRVSRHEVPKTPGNDDAFKVYDPARVSHIPASQSVRHPSGVEGSLATSDPRVVGATPLDPGLKSGHPCRGASPTYPLLAPTGGAPLAGARSIGIGHPRSGDRCVAPHPCSTTPPGCRRAEPPFSATPDGVEAYGVCLYIGRRHFVPRPMPMERASYGCRRAEEREDRRERELASDLSDSSDSSDRGGAVRLVRLVRLVREKSITGNSDHQTRY